MVKTERLVSIYFWSPCIVQHIEHPLLNLSCRRSCGSARAGIPFYLSQEDPSANIMSHYTSPAKEETEVSTAARGLFKIGEGDLSAINHEDKTENHHEYSISTNNTRSLIEALSSAALEGANVTTITANSCGIAFLDNLHDTLPGLEQTMARVRSLTLDTDLVTLDAFKWETEN